MRPGWGTSTVINMLNLTIVQILPLTCLSVTLSMSGFHKGQGDI